MHPATEAPPLSAVRVVWGKDLLYNSGMIYVETHSYTLASATALRVFKERYPDRPNPTIYSVTKLEHNVPYPTEQPTQADRATATLSKVGIIDENGQVIELRSAD
jgi:hypothetical protein